MRKSIEAILPIGTLSTLGSALLDGTRRWLDEPRLTISSTRAAISPPGGASAWTWSGLCERCPARTSAAGTVLVGEQHVLILAGGAAPPGCPLAARPDPPPTRAAQLPSTPHPQRAAPTRAEQPTAGIVHQGGSRRADAVGGWAW